MIFDYVENFRIQRSLCNPASLEFRRLQTMSIYNLRSNYLPNLAALIPTLCRGSGDLMVRSRPWIWKAPGPKPDSPEDAPCLWAWCMPNLMWVKHPHYGVVWKLGKGGAS
ncbi:hypothetical protein AVEN_269606-1 [Araneus ventricosus]|uniref:Uncharacterized protein n=1 Tax=Araneus ventricosus TaxID=182803 RepID=A0A4Y2CE45_ARAVE|nr:hypothetical protein AVEN_269606-1 [Araneus ventricosus]